MNLKNNGVTLVEVIVASVILVIAMIPLWGLMGSSHKQAMSSSDELRLAQIASEILEQIEAGKNIPTEGELFPNGSEDTIKHVDFPSYIESIKFKITTEDDPPIRRITVSYKDKTVDKTRQYTVAGFK